MHVHRYGKNVLPFLGRLARVLLVHSGSQTPYRGCSTCEGVCREKKSAVAPTEALGIFLQANLFLRKQAQELRLS